MMQTQNLFINFVQSNTFSNISKVYINYISATTLLGLGVGAIGSICYLRDVQMSNEIEKKTIDEIKQRR